MPTDGSDPIEATGPDGAVVTYEIPTVVGGNVTCVKASGETFPIGLSTVTCTANIGDWDDECTFTVKVVDTTKPDLKCPIDMTNIAKTGDTDDGGAWKATSKFGAVVEYATPNATDLVDTDVEVVCSPPSGEVFPLGTTTVNCTATDDSGNTEFDPTLQSQCSFTVLVVDDTAPGANCPEDAPGIPKTYRKVATSSDEGAFVNFTLPDDTFTDDVDANITVICSPPTGSFFKLGNTSVTCIALDDAGNTASCPVNVEVISAPSASPSASPSSTPTSSVSLLFVVFLLEILVHTPPHLLVLFSII